MHVHMLDKHFYLGRVGRQGSKGHDSALPLFVDVVNILLLYTVVAPTAWSEKDPIPSTVGL